MSGHDGIDPAGAAQRRLAFGLAVLTRSQVVEIQIRIRRTQRLLQDAKAALAATDWVACTDILPASCQCSAEDPA